MANARHQQLAQYNKPQERQHSRGSDGMEVGMEMAIWLDVPDWLLHGSCGVSSQWIGLGDWLNIGLQLVWY